jgi:hypothetical protein
MTARDQEFEKDKFIRLTGIDETTLTEIVGCDFPLLPGLYMPIDLQNGRKFTFADVLALDLARALSDGGSPFAQEYKPGLQIPVARALRLVAYAGAVEAYMQYEDEFRHDKFVSDLWFGVLGIRTEYSGDEVVTAHFAGPFHQIVAEMTARMVRDEARGLEQNDPAWTLLANVSASARRLEKRVAEKA